MYVEVERESDGARQTTKNIDKPIDLNTDEVTNDIYNWTYMMPDEQMYRENTNMITYIYIYYLFNTKL